MIQIRDLDVGPGDHIELTPLYPNRNFPPKTNFDEKNQTKKFFTMTDFAHELLFLYFSTHFLSIEGILYTFTLYFDHIKTRKITLKKPKQNVNLTQTKGLTRLNQHNTFSLHLYTPKQRYIQN
jgi:hypothetical protein